MKFERNKVISGVLSHDLTTLVKNTILCCSLCSFWDHHQRNLFEVVQLLPQEEADRIEHVLKGGLHFTMWPLLNYTRALNVDFYNSSEFADPQVTTSVNIISLVLFKWRLFYVFPKSFFFAGRFSTES